MGKKVKPLQQSGEIEEILRLIVQLVEKTIQELLKILEEIGSALIESLPGQD